MDEQPDTDEELNPAAVVEGATADTAAAVDDILVEALADDDIPGEMRRDIRARLAELRRRFPQSGGEGSPTVR